MRTTRLQINDNVTGVPIAGSRGLEMGRGLMMNRFILVVILVGAVMSPAHAVDRIDFDDFMMFAQAYGAAPGDSGYSPMFNFTADAGNIPRVYTDTVYTGSLTANNTVAGTWSPRKNRIQILQCIVTATPDSPAVSLFFDFGAASLRLADSPVFLGGFYIGGSGIAGWSGVGLSSFLGAIATFNKATLDWIQAQTSIPSSSIPFRLKCIDGNLSSCIFRINYIGFD